MTDEILAILPGGGPQADYAIHCDCYGATQIVRRDTHTGVIYQLPPGPENPSES